ncbi:MAG: anaerobic sulfatase maturase [Clostridiales bacterium]|nr:anaerobic sulfatase maturase [Clostridiales bacterium]
MPAASILIKPASANCNMDCRYCFYKCLSSNRAEYSKGFMTDETLEQLVKGAIEYADGFLTFAFQGGEPTLCGIEFYRKVLALQKKYNTKHLEIENTIQTNGLLIDEQWAGFLSENHFLVGLSLDGPRKIHDRYRVGYDGGGTFFDVMHAAELFDRYRVDYNILCVVTEESTKHAAVIYHFFRKHDMTFLQFIPCLDEGERSQRACDDGNPAAVTASSYGKFLCELFDLWYEDFSRGVQIDIRMFSNLAQLAAGYPAEECGMNGCCSCYFVTEGNGDVYPRDFYCTDEWRLGTVADSFDELVQCERAKRFVEISLQKDECCRDCAYFSLCRGGCRRWREQAGTEKPGRNRLCEAYRMLFEHAGERIEVLGNIISERYGN